jgi:hypothetical protein
MTWREIIRVCPKLSASATTLETEKLDWWVDD